MITKKRCRFPSFKRIRPVGIVVLMALLWTDAGCKKKNDMQVEAASVPVAIQVVTVDVATAEKVPVRISIDAVGTLEAAEDVMISTRRSGLVEEICFEEGQAVEKGQLLIRLDHDMARLERDQAGKRVERMTSSLARMDAEVRRAQAQVDNACSNFERKETLFKEEATTRAVFVDAKTQYEGALAALDEAKASLEEAKCLIVEEKAGLEIAEEHLAETRINASMDGILGERFAGPGDFVDKGGALVRLVSINPLKARFSVPERYQGRIHLEQKISLTVEAWPERRFEGQVFYLAPALDPETRTIRVKAFVDNQDNLLRPGFFCNIQLILEEKPEAVVIPEEAIVPRGDNFFVYKVEAGKAVLQKVTPGQRTTGRVEIVNGLKAGECVITAGLQRVTDGYPVRIRKGVPPSRAGASGGANASKPEPDREVDS
ncbi:MAG: efflux RND transporter periplasmic adaptor subunit [Planctomycetota bacterium]